MTTEQEEKLATMRLTEHEKDITRQIVDALTEEQRDTYGQFADESKINASAAAELRYLNAEGFFE